LQGWEIISIAVEGEAKEEDFQCYGKTYAVRPEQLGRLIEILLSENVKDAVMAGKVHKKRIFKELKPDARSLKVFFTLPNTTDDTLLGAIAKELESEGIKLHPTTFCLNGIMVREGLIVGKAPSLEQWKDVLFGWKIAKEIGRMDIGQTVVVKGGSVLAVEAIEGTDEAIKRGGKLGGSNSVVIKVAKPQQDVRFDMPVVGINTIQSMIESKATLLAMEAGWTILLDREKVKAMASEAGITIVAVTDPPPEKIPF
jgi:DUF1009 family protein